MTKTIAIALAATTLAATPALAQRVPAASVVVIDTQRITNECNACKVAITQLKAQADAIQARQQALAAPLQTEGQAIQTTINALQGKAPDAALQARIAAFEQKQRAAATELQGRQQTFQRNQAFVAQQVNSKLATVVKAVMQAKGANVAVDQGAVLANEAAVDGTSVALAQLNAQLTTINVNAPAAPAPAAPTGR